jgi:ABC-type antimicrobial peptide transport system permease subunit
MSDLKLAFRSLRATPVVSAVAALSLALAPLTIAGAAFVLGAVGALAGWLPAYRASRIDPAQVLRDS